MFFFIRLILLLLLQLSNESLWLTILLQFHAGFDSNIHFDDFKFGFWTPMLNIITYFLLFKTCRSAKLSWSFIVVLILSVTLLIVLFALVHLTSLPIWLDVQTLHFLRILPAIFNFFSFDNYVVRRRLRLSQIMLLPLFKLILLIMVPLQKYSQHIWKYVRCLGKSNEYNNTLTVWMNCGT